MHLKRLELVGFKSFAAKTGVDLQPGVVVVVGPNGSGKSNISDAVRWVLGEQSAKAVRARKAEEVIFAGSSARQPLGMAEVSLILDNADGTLPLDFSDVKITRRLYRSGDSEYLLNNARVRLKDITQHLLHAGLGPDTYAVIGQSSVDELILQRPEERRIAFESAADIRRHQLKLTDTRSRLATTQANLTRVQDVIAELGPHVKRLKAQADRASRAEQVRTELHKLLVVYYRARLRSAHAELAEGQRELAAASASTSAARAATSGQEALARAGDEAALGYEQEIAALRAEASAAQGRLRDAERTLAVTRERAAGLTQQTANLTEQRDRLAVQVERLERQVAEQASLPSAPLEDGARASELEDVRREIRQLEVSQAEARRVRDVSLQARGRAERAVADAEKVLRQYDEQIRTHQAEASLEGARQADREARLAQLETAQATQRRDVTTAETTLNELRRRLQAAVDARWSANDALEVARERLRLRGQQVDRLQGALEALGAAAAPGDAAAGLPSEWVPTLEDLPVVGVAADMESRVPPLSGLVRGFLQRVVVLADDGSAREAHARLSRMLGTETSAWAVLSLEGLLLPALGERSIASAAGGSSALANWSEEVRRLEAERAAAAREYAEADQQVVAAQSVHETAEQQERASRTMVADAEAQLQLARRSLDALEREHEEVRAAEQRFRANEAQRSMQQVAVLARVTAARDELETTTAARASTVQDARAAEERLAQITAELTDLRLRGGALESTMMRQRAEYAATAAIGEHLRAELAAANTAWMTVATRVEEHRAQHVDLARAIEGLEHAVRGRTVELEPLEGALTQAEERRARERDARRAMDERLDALRRAEREAHAQREQALIRAQRVEGDLERLDQEILQVAEMDLDVPGGASWAAQLRLDLDTTADMDMDMESTRRRIATLQRDLRAIGGVAETVIEEYRELHDRHEFLAQQSGDLRTAMGELETAAHELEENMSGRFSAVLEAVEAAFVDCFKTLFGGGEARLVLTQPDDLLRTGIDIVARPPGKKLQALLSLSGGERALTVVALLFGLLRVNPTPFCVLDEVDAALDESNVQRFTDLLGELAQRIQFIVVTHNRATMEKADAMYGVTMDAMGVSRVLSVRPRATAALVP